MIEVNMLFVDTHTHLYDEAFDGDRDVVAGRAVAGGVSRWIFPAIDSASFERQHSCAVKYPRNAFMAMGLHPTSVAANWRYELEFALGHLRRSFEPDSGVRYIAVGEIGLDGYWSKEFMQEQKEVFSAQLDAALEYDLPVIIHERSAMVEMFDVLEGKPRNLRGVFHAFGGSIETYRRIGKYGDFKVGIGGVVTFRNAGVAATVADVPLEDILLETDSPWLTPAPYRGKRNESSYIPLIAAKVAEIKGLDIGKVAETTTSGAEKLFRLQTSGEK